MKLSFAAMTTALGLLAHTALAMPQATPVIHCGGPDGLVCPDGYRCCGPIIVGVGGRCFKGATGFCPL